MTYPKRIPIIEPLDFRRCNVFEHTPMDYYRYGEYPRFLRPVDAHEPRSVVVWNEREEKAAIDAVRGEK